MSRYIEPIDMTPAEAVETMTAILERIGTLNDFNEHYSDPEIKPWDAITGYCVRCGALVPSLFTQGHFDYHKMLTLQAMMWRIDMDNHVINFHFRGLLDHQHSWE